MDSANSYKIKRVFWTKMLHLFGHLTICPKIKHIRVSKMPKSTHFPLSPTHIQFRHKHAHCSWIANSISFLFLLSWERIGLIHFLYKGIDCWRCVWQSLDFFILFSFLCLYLSFLFTRFHRNSEFTYIYRVQLRSRRGHVTTIENVFAVGFHSSIEEFL